MATIEITKLEVLAFKKIVLINYALAKSLKDKSAAAEQLALTRALNDFVLRADFVIENQTGEHNERR